MTDVPPHDEQAEQAILGAIMTSAQAVRDVAETIGPEDFYLPRHQEIYQAALRIQQAGHAIDPVTLAAELTDRGQIVRVGGTAYLHTLFAGAVNAGNAGYYAQIVSAKATLRRVIETGMHVTQLGYAAGIDDVDEIIEHARSAVDKLAQARRATADTFELLDLIPAALDSLEQPVKPGYPTGWRDVDAVLGGLHPGTLTIIGARPGVGKSILGLRIAAHVAASGYGALMFSLEMSRAELMSRFFASEAAVELTALHRHDLSDEDWNRVSNVAAKALEWPLAVTDAPHIGLTGMTSRARDRTRTARSLAVVVVDYLQLVTPPDRKASREQQIGAISRGLKLMARELNIAVVAAAQLNRGPQQRSDRRPAMSDLRESGAIEADADSILLLHETGREGELEVIIDKNRQGPKKTVKLAWAPYYATARDLAIDPHGEAS